MDFKQFRARSKANPLDGVDVLGSFDFHTSIVSLDSLELRHFSAFQQLQQKATQFGRSGSLEGGSLSESDYQVISKVLPLAAHEYTHFLDATSTLWGLKHLSLMNDAYLSDEIRGGTEADFSKAKKFHDHLRRLHLPPYYTTIEDKIDDSRPWVATPSIGRVFDATGVLRQPVLFTRFYNEAGKLIVRSPLSPVSLLEASAMAQELFSAGSLVRLCEPDFRVVEEKLFSQRQLLFLYDKELTEYSVCVHRVANQQEYKDAMAAFRVCALLIRFAFNFPSSAYRKLGSLAFEELVSGNIQFGDALAEGIGNEDPGILFFLLSSRMPKVPPTNQATLTEGVNQALAGLGIERRFFEQELALEVESIQRRLTMSPITPIAAMAAAGVQNLRSIGHEEPFLSFSRFHLPPVLLGDSTIVSVFDSPQNILGKSDLSRWDAELYRGQQWVEHFAKACV